jgi:hypothetical protein
MGVSKLKSFRYVITEVSLAFWKIALTATAPALSPTARRLAAVAERPR